MERVGEERITTWKVLGGEETLRQKKKTTSKHISHFVWKDDGKKNMSVAGQGTQTSSLLAQEHRDMKIKVENTAAQGGEKNDRKGGGDR